MTNTNTNTNIFPVNKKMDNLRHCLKTIHRKIVDLVGRYLTLLAMLEVHNIISNFSFKPVYRNWILGVCYKSFSKFYLKQLSQ